MKEKRPVWFKMFLQSKAMIEAVSNESAGAALKALLAYFETGVIPEIKDPFAKVVFDATKIYVDDAFADYAESVNNGKKGSAARHRKRT